MHRKKLSSYKGFKFLRSSDAKSNSPTICALNGQISVPAYSSTTKRQNITHTRTEVVRRLVFSNILA